MGHQRSQLLLLAALLCGLATAARAATYTVVWGPDDLLRALALAAASPLNDSVIELPRNISLDPSAAAAYELPLRINGRLALRRGECRWLAQHASVHCREQHASPAWSSPAGLATLIALCFFKLVVDCRSLCSRFALPPPAQDAEAVSLHLGGIPQLLFLQRGAQLELANLTVAGGLAMHECLCAYICVCGCPATGLLNTCGVGPSWSWPTWAAQVGWRCMCACVHAAASVALCPDGNGQVPLWLLVQLDRNESRQLGRTTQQLLACHASTAAPTLPLPPHASQASRLRMHSWLGCPHRPKRCCCSRPLMGSRERR